MTTTYHMKFKTVTLLFSLMIFFLPSSLLAETSKNLAVFYELEGKDAEARYNKLVEEVLPTIGYNLADPHKRVNDQYKSKYGSTNLDVLSFMPVVNDNKVMPLFNIDPRLAGFSPFNMLIHKTLDEDKTHVGHLTPEAILDILSIDDKVLSEKFIASFKPLDDLLDKEFGKRTYTKYGKLSADRMINFEYEFERPDDIDDFIDDFQNSFEMSFINKQYLIAGFHDFLETEDGEEMLENFDIFWAYSLCHLEYSYNMFDNKGARPDAGLYAPCTMYMYVKKGTNKLVVGMPKLVNILDTLGVSEASRLALVAKLDKEIPEILTAFGMIAVENVNPFTQTPKRKEIKEVEKKVKKELESKVEKEIEPKEASTSKTLNIILPKVPTVPTPIKIQINGETSHSGVDRSIKFSKRTPANYITSAERYGKNGAGSTLSQNKELLGEVSKGRISAYLRGALMDANTATEKLKKAGFEVLATDALNKKKTLLSIVFTNAELKKMSSKENRGFMGTLRLLIDPANDQISITNPLYLGKALLQNDFDEEASRKILTALTSEFSGLKNSFDKLKYQLLPNYQFMDGMPYFKDMMVIARGDDLVKQLKNNKKVIFELKLDNGSTLVGIDLSKRTKKFPNRIGTKNAAMLPYPLLIENGEAKILDPKYYLALMYPQLSMEEFMSIATVPDAIRKDSGKVFK